LALACDIVVAAKSAKFIEPFCRLGLIPDTGGTYFLPRLLGTARSMGLALLSEHRGPLSGASFWKCVDDAELKPVTEEIADRLASSPRLALAHAKRAIYASGANSFDEQLNLERDLLPDVGKTPEYRAAVAAFLESRGRPAAD